MWQELFKSPYFRAEKEMSEVYRLQTFFKNYYRMKLVQDFSRTKAKEAVKVKVNCWNLLILILDLFSFSAFVNFALTLVNLTYVTYTYILDILILYTFHIRKQGVFLIFQFGKKQNRKYSV